MDLAGLQAAVATAVPAVGVPDPLVDGVCTLRAALRRQELVCTDRRCTQAVRLLQASAYLDGRQTVEAADLAVVTAVLRDSTAQRPVSASAQLPASVNDHGQVQAVGSMR